ncbi:nucleotide exchange factor GrpE [Cohnella silvisoli]|uniref:Protein GrpE n=1 Tax=Cohnella silvisoli TaxID=2873699 RepID=A0ABV1KUR6_9BACL|nr:nucleotide exchange factor GrpE [Cohnella silvisoli]MCD9023017.1 nucleotide exchange factor GrpE [Cohnella silvisoli]
MSKNETKEPVIVDEQQEVSFEEQDVANENNETSPLEGEHSAEASGQDSVVAELQRQADDNHSRYLRAQADFDNFRRRTLKEKEEITQYASLKVIGQLLPVLDNFQRALQTGAEGAESGSFAKGVDMIYRQLNQVLEAEGLKQLEAIGQPFDPELHQAIMQVESEEHEAGTIVEVIQPGYKLKDKVIRPAMVKVSG